MAYVVDINVKVDDSKLNELEKRINSIKDKTIPIKLEVDSSSLKGIESQLKNASKTQTLKMNADTSGVKKEVSSVEDQFKRLVSLQQRIGSTKSKLSGLNAKDDISDVVSLNKHLNNLTAEYNKLFAASKQNLSTTQIAELKRQADVNTSSIKQTTSAYKELLGVSKQIGSLNVKIKGLDASSNPKQISQLTSELKGLEATYQKLKSNLSGRLSTGQLNGLDSEAEKTKNRLAELDAKIADTKAKLASGIKLKVENSDISKQVSEIGGKFDSLKAKSSSAVDAMSRFTHAQKELNSAIKSGDNSKVISAYDNYQNSLKKVKNQIDINVKAEKELANVANLRQSASNLSSEMDLWLKRNSAAAENFGKIIRNLQGELETCDATRLSEIQSEFKNVKTQAELAGKTGLKTMDKLKAQFSKLGTYFSVSSVMLAGMQAFRSAFENVREVDTAMTELKRVTDLSASQYSDIYNDLTVSAREYGTTLADIINATADWSRAGFDPDIAKGLAEVTTMYQHIADVDYQTAFENLETAYKGFESQLTQDFGSDTVSAVSYIGDILNELDNNFAVTADGVGEAMKRSASAMSIAGNTIQETAGMVTGITEVTQDPEKAGNALKVLGMRLRGMKGELEDLGEDVDDNVVNLSKMQGQVLRLTHSKVNIFDDTGEFKSTYEIMQGIADIYDDLSSSEQADLLETIAGKHRANDVAALISNWKNVEEATKSATDATGSAEREHAKYVDSIEGRLNSLTSVWQTLSNELLNTDLVKGAISAFSGLLDVVTKLVDAIGGLGTVALFGGLFLGIKNFSSITSTISDLAGAFSGGIKSAGDFGAAVKLTGETIFSSFSRVLGGVGIVAGVISAIVTAYQNYQESLRKARQETIDTSNAFNDSYGSFEQVYIKYADRSSLTVDEENELKNAIDGTVNALGDKSGALRDAIGASDEYFQNLDKIAKAEAEQSKIAATSARQAAEENLKQATKDNFWFTGRSNMSFKLSNVSKKEYKTIEDLVKQAESLGYSTGDARHGNEWLMFNKSDSLDETLSKMNLYTQMRDRLSESNNTDNQMYKDMTSTLDQMSTYVDEIVKQTYSEAKATYQVNNGMATSVEQFYKMREAVLDAAGDSVAVRSSVGKLMNEEYGDTFDLSSVESQIDYIKSVTKDIEGISGGKVNTFETLLDLQTKVNNGECSVGDYHDALENADEAINQIEDVDTQNFLRVQLGLEFDSEGNIDDEVEKLRTKLINDLKNNDVSSEVAASVADGLSKSELEAAIQLVAEGKIDVSNVDSEDVKRQIEELANLNEKIAFTVDVDVETENLEKLNTAISESLSGSGLGTESMTVVEKMFNGLDSYDPSKLFERTANGIRLNTDELRKMNNEYKATNIDGLDEKMSALGDKYNKTREKLSNLAYGTDEYNEKARELSDIEAQINATEELAAQYEGLTSAYNEWQNAESAGSQRDMYEGVIEGFDNVKDEISRGWMDDGSIEFLELLTGKNLDGANVKKLKSEWDGLSKTIKGTSYNVKDFFTTNDDGESTSKGVFNFLDAVDQKFKDSDIIKRDGNNNIIGFDFKVAGGDEAIADALGISEELVQIMVRAADDAGFVVSMDGTYQNLDVLKEKAQDAANSLKKMFKGTENEITTKFDLQTNDEDSIMKQYKSALDIWEGFKKNKNADGTINMEVKGAEEAFTLVSTLQSMVDKLSEPTYMDVDASEVDKNLQTPLSKLQEYERLTQEEHQLNLKGTDTSEIQKSKDEVLNYFDEIKKNQPEIAAKFGIDKLSREELEQKLNDGSLELDASLNLQVEMNNTLRDQVNLALYNAGLIDKEELEKRVDVDVYAENVDTSDVDNKTEEAVENSSESDKKTETKVDVEAKAGEVDTSDVKDKTEEAVKDESGESTDIEKSVDLEVKVEEYRELIQDLEDVNKDIEINVKINGLDKVDELNNKLDITSKVDGKVEDLTKFADAAKKLDGVSNNITKTVTGSLYGNLDKNKNLDSLQQFIDGAKELDGVKSSFVTVNASVDGNLDGNKNVDKLTDFAEGAKALEGVKSSSVAINADLEANIGGFLGFNPDLNNVKKFAEAAESLEGISDADVSVKANLEANIGGVLGYSPSLDNIERFAEGAKALEGIDSSDVTVGANLNANLGGILGYNPDLNNLDKFIDNAEKIEGITDSDVTVKANLDANLGGILGYNPDLNNLDKFIDSAEKISGIDDSDVSVKANLDANVGGIFGYNADLNNLDKFTESAKKISGVEDSDVSVKANLEANVGGIFGYNPSLDNLDKFTESAKKISGVDSSNVTVAATLDANTGGILGYNPDLNNLDKFIDGAKKLSEVESSTTNISAHLDANIGGILGSNSDLDNLDKFAEGAKKLEGISDADVSVKAHLDANTGGFLGNNPDLDNLDKFAEAAEKLNDIESYDVTVSATLNANTGGFLGYNPDLNNLDKFANAADKLNDVDSSDVTVNATLNANIDDTKVNQLSSFADGAKKLQDVNSKDVKVTANLDGDINSNTANNLSAFAEGAKKLQGVGDASVTVTANLKGEGVSNNLFGYNSTLSNLEAFAAGAKKLQGVGDVSSTVTANLKGEGLSNNLFGSNSKLSNLSTFADNAKKLNGINDKSVNITANLNGNIGEKTTSINNLPSFASTASTLQGVSSKDVTITANIEGGLTSEKVSTLSSFSSVVSSLPSSANVTVTTSVNTEKINSAITTLKSLSSSGVMHDYNANVTVKAKVDSSNVDSYKPKDKTGTAKYKVDKSAVDKWNPEKKKGTVIYTPKVEALTESQKNKTGTITYKAKVEGVGGADGTAHVNGSAFANGSTGKAFSHGDWGTKKDGVALGGELGQELVS